MKKIVFVIMMVSVIALPIASAVSAADWRYSEARYIDYVFPQATSFTVVLQGSKINTNTSCTNRFTVDSSLAYHDEIVMTILIAYAVGAQIMVYFDNAITSCSSPIQRVRAY